TSTETEEPLVSIEGEEGTSDAAGTTTDSESSDTATEEDSSTETEEPLVSIEGEEGTAGTTADSESTNTEIISENETVESASVQVKQVAKEDLDETQFVSYELTADAERVEEEIVELENEAEGIDIKIGSTKNKGEKAELAAQKIQVESDLEEKQKEHEILNLQLEVILRVEEGLFDNPAVAEEESKLALAKSEELEFEAVELKESAKQKRDSVEVVKKKQKDEYIDAADKLDREADRKFEESAQMHQVAERVKNAVSRINDLLALAEQQLAVLELPEVTKVLTEEDKQAIADSPEYKNYELVVVVARKKYQEADVLYVRADSLKEASALQKKEAAALREQADLATDGDFERELELYNQATALDSLSAQNERKANKLFAHAEVIYQEADEKVQEAAQYLATVDQETYENIVAYEFSIDQNSARVAKELALAKVARDAEMAKTGSEVAENMETEREIVVAPINSVEAVVEDITQVAATIDVVPTNLQTEIFVQEATPTRSVYTESKPIPQDTKLPEGVIYKVQVGAFRNTIPQDHFVGFAPIMGESAGGGLTRYTAGVFNKFNSANSAKNQIRNISSNYGDAFVVAYFNGVRIPISEARRIEREGGGSAQTVTTETRPVDNAVVTTTSSSVDDAPISVNTPIRTNGGNNASGNAKATGVQRISGLFYTVQVGVYSKRVPASQLYNITPLNTDELPGGTIRYSSGVYTDLGSANIAKDRIREIGIADAFVTAYYNGARIAVSEARQLVADNGSAIYTDGTVSGGTNQSASDGEQVDKVFFKVSLGRYGDGVPISVASAILRLSNQVDKKNNDDGTTSYYIGKFTDIQSAEKMQKEVVNEGVKAAKVIGTKNGEEISIDEAKRLLGE
ncbi:MAG: hypothetical protein JKY42_01700, partial [Flavobacteriales bacterium]|nr:hypothetical protein [Flavobacteriales bacterium]